jgi:hypothetical protein
MDGEEIKILISELSNYDDLIGKGKKVRKRW